MKDLKIKKNGKENKGKVFTKNKRIDIINKDYNPLKVNYEIYKRRDGLYNMKNMILKEAKRDFNFKDKLFIHIFARTFIKVYKKGIERGFNSRI